MLRMESETGWWLTTHPDHARLAGAFAEAWGNEEFRKPEPRARVLHGIYCHDDGWIESDRRPSITREGKPSAFSVDLVGKYSALEEIDIEEHLTVRARAVRIIAEEDPYAGLLISMHNYNLLTEHADRHSIEEHDLALLDAFLDKQRDYQRELLFAIMGDESLSPSEKTHQCIQEHFRLLQACDCLSLLACVGFASPSHLLHPLPLNDGSNASVKVLPVGERQFRLNPWPFSERQLSFNFPARHIEGKHFGSSAELEIGFLIAPVEQMRVELSA